MENRYSAIIFDWAGVFCTPGEPFSHPELAKQTGLAVDEMGEATKQIQEQYYKGLITPSEFWNKVIAHFGLKNLSAQKLSRAYTSSYRVYPEMMELARKIKNKYRTALLSNLTQEMMGHIIANHNALSYFHHGIFSNQVGLIKPEAGIYYQALKKLGGKPDETVFVDDSAKNVAAAIALGLTGIVFQSKDQLEIKLKKLGLDF